MKRSKSSGRLHAAGSFEVCVDGDVMRDLSEADAWELFFHHRWVAGDVKLVKAGVVLARG